VTEKSTTQSTTQSSEELLGVGQSVTLIARDPLVNDSEVYHETQQIDSDGNVTVPAVGRVRAAGLASSDLQQSINRAYEGGQQAASVQWQVVTLAPSVVAATPATMPTTMEGQIGAEQFGTRAQPSVATTSPTTEATTNPAAAMGAAGAAGAGAPVDLVIVIRPAGEAPGNNAFPTTQVAPIASPSAAAPDGGPAPTTNPAATEPSPGTPTAAPPATDPVP
jgi:hypothetical protein